VLRALQENRITRVGGEKEINVNVRVIAATNKDLQKEIATGKFREDLYHRLAVIIIDVPPLKDRIEDIPVLVDHFTEEICQDYGVPKKTFTPRALKKLQALQWTGNIRELRNVVERLIILSGDTISDKDIDQFVAPASPVQGQFRTLFKEFRNVEEVHRYIDKEYESFRKS
jgi:DNA-binding NtrC family response regulator